MKIDKIKSFVLSLLSNIIFCNYEHFQKYNVLFIFIITNIIKLHII
jgi:hypothetical protein